MGDFWSHEEVEAIVADYFKMLDNELRGIHYNKTEHRRALSILLNTAPMDLSSANTKI